LSKDKIIGLIISILSVLGIVLYAWLVFLSPWFIDILKITAFVAVAIILGIVAWIGYTIATAPEPKPIEEIEKELEKTIGPIEEKVQKKK